METQELVMRARLAKNVVNISQINWDLWTNCAKSFLQLTSDIVVCLTPAYEITELSSAAEEHYQWKKSDILGKNYLELCRLHHLSSPLLDHIQTITPTEPLSEVQEIIPSANNNGIIIIKWTGTYLFNIKGQPFGLIVCGKKSFQNFSGNYSSGIQRYLDSMIEVVPGSFYVKDKNGVYLTCNNVVLQKGNLSDKNHIIGKTDFDVWPEQAENIKKNDMEVIEQGKTLELEETIILPDGKKMYFASVKMPLRDENGKVIGIVCNSLDVTELKEAKEKAEKANIIKTEFIHNMEHDIRTPFNGIYALANLLYEEETDPKKKEYLEEIANSGKELLDFCNTILDFSKIEMGILPVLSKKFNLLNVLERAITIENPAIKQKKLSLFVKHDPNLPKLIVGDDYRLLRILLNLLSNSIKFTKQGHVSLITEIAKLNHKKVIIKFTVEDTGIGIPEEKINFIYEKFSKLNASNTNRYKGFGLGLRIVKQFIDELEGEIDVISEVDKGTIFSFILPFDIPLADRDI